MSDYDEITIIRLREENDRLRAENAVLRPMVSDLQHRLRIAERNNPDQIRKDREHG